MTSSALSSSMAATRSRTVVAVAARGVNRMCAGLADGGVARPWRSSSSSSSLLSSIRSHKTHDKSVLPITATPLRVTCMANPRRVAKVQQQMRREISNMLQTDKNIRSMISPEERMGVDNVISVMVTVADVEVSNDLQVVKVFVSILSDDRGKKNAINGLKKLEGYVRRNIGKKVSLRLTPEIRFVYDDSFERGQRVSSLLDELREQREVKDAGGTQLRSTKSELLAVEDTISNPYDDEEDDWMDTGDDADEDEDDLDDVDIEQGWNEMQKGAKSGGTNGDDGFINVQ